MSFVRACAVAEVPLGTALSVTLGADTEIAVVHTGEGFFAIRDECSHACVPLSEGEVEDTTLECFMHGSRFDLRTGMPLELPAVEPVPVYPIAVDGETVLIDIDHPINNQES